jgi:hypothetical protein
VVLGLVLVAGGATAPTAGAATKVGPTQYFTGVINGNDGNTALPIVIKVACARAVGRVRTGHPVSGQTLAVHQLFPPSPATGTVGQTGNDSEIGVFFNAPPPAAARPRASASPAFTRYDKTKPLSTALTLPCSGTGTVWFSPIPVVPPSSAASVPVTFEARP